MRNGLKKTLRYSLSFAAAAVLLYFSFRGVQWADFSAALKNCKWGFIAASMAAGAFIPFFRALRWRRTIVPFDSSIDKRLAVNATYIGYLTNIAVPFTVIVTRWVIIHRRSSSGNSSYDKLMGTSALELTCDALCILIILLILLFSAGKTFGKFYMDSIVTPLTANALTLIIIFLVIALLVAFCIVVYRFRDKNVILGKIYTFMRGLYDGFRSFMKMENKLAFVLETLLLWLAYCLQVYFISFAVPGVAHLSLTDSLFICVLGTIASIVPVPGSFGAYHFLVATALSSIYGISWENGIVFATLAHESQTLVLIICGITALIINAFDMRKAKRKPAIK